MTPSWIPVFWNGLSLLLVAAMLASGVAIARTRNLYAAVIYASLVSFAMAGWFLLMDAPDLAFTEAAVGAGASTVLALGGVLATRGEAAPRPSSALIGPAAAAVALFVLLAFAAGGLPAPGDPTAPANVLGRSYVSSAPSAIGMPNVVTAVLASWRAFDTLGETVVIFSAGVGALLLLGFGERSLGAQPRLLREPEAVADPDRRRHVVLQVAAKLLTPVIGLFAFSTLFGGEGSIGGGFQAGVILAAGVVLHALVFGVSDAMRAFSPGFVRGLAALGLLVFLAIGLGEVTNGGPFLAHDWLAAARLAATEVDLSTPDNAEHLARNWGQALGVLGVEIGVFLTVSATFVGAFYALAGRALDVVAQAESPAQPAARRKRRRKGAE